MGITGELVRSVFSKSQSIPRQGSEKRKWSRSVRSYLCGGEHSSVLAAEEEFTSFRSNVATNKSSVTRDDVDVVSEATVEQPNTNEKRKEDAAFIIQSAYRNFMARRARERVQTYSIREVRRGKIQQDWDDSTVSSVISKMRMQKRLEAATRRQRALAYAFSQQLRICSKKHRTSVSGDEANMGWSWLERWMATRQPEMNLFQDKARALMDEKESCGSNDLSSLPNKPKRTQTSTPTHFTPKDSKDVNKVWHKEKRKRQKQPGFNKNATALQL